jgi:low affinity Fe/Cu permease
VEAQMKESFRKVSQAIAHWVGSPQAFALALIGITLWLFLGPVFHYSDTWQLVINTTTTIITFLMVFLIQNTQNRDARAFHLKLDELIRSHKGARNQLIELENLSDLDLDILQDEFRRNQKQYAENIENISKHKKMRHQRKQ